MSRKRKLPDHLVGVHDHVEAIIDKLNEGSRDVCYLVIHGMGGIGKTTLAKAVFNQISNRFAVCSFLSDIREYAKHQRIVDLQKTLLLEILQSQFLETLTSVDMGIEMIRKTLCDKKVLLILDDVDNRDQLSKLAGKSDWFGSGSRIIITTRDINFLPIKEKDKESSFQAHSQEFQYYKMKEMDFFYALRLFSKHAFEMDLPPHDFDDISRKITITTGGLPLAIAVIGSSLQGKSKTSWKVTLQKLKSVPNREVFNKLKVSYDMLEPEQQEIFLDIACFFIGKDILHPSYMWKASNYFPEMELLVLTHKSLIKITKDLKFWMHDQLRDLGREIVRCEDINFPENCSRLWEPEFALEVVQRKKGTQKVVALKLTRLSKKQTFTSEQFSKLPNLRFLELEGGDFVGDFQNLLSKLTWLTWVGCPLDLSATNLCLEKLVVLLLSRSDITEDWAGWKSCLVSENLKVIEIYFGTSMKRIPDFSKCSNLRRLTIQSCASLLVNDGSLSQLEHLKYLKICSWNIVTLYSPIEANRCDDLFPKPSIFGSLKSLSTLIIKGMSIHELPHSIGEMTSLNELSLTNSNLPKLPNSVGDLRMLRTMTLTDSWIAKLPKTIGGLESLLELDLTRTRIRKLPASIGNLKKLRKMSMLQAPIKKLPKEIGGLESLLVLDLNYTKITKLPTSIGKLKQLEILGVIGTAIRELPKAIWMLKNLKVLNAGYCENMEGEIPSEIEGLSFLRGLQLSKSKIRRLPTTMNKLSHLQQLCLDQCYELEQLPKLPVSLKELKFSPLLLWTALDLSYLSNLVDLHIKYDTPWFPEFRQGAPNIKWIEGLYCLEKLTLVIGDVKLPRINLATLSCLRILEITCVRLQSLKGLPSSLEELTLRHVKSPMKRSLFSNLKNLSRLWFYHSQLRKVEFDDVLGQQLEKLRMLGFHEDKLLRRLTISGLEGLQQFSTRSCPALMEIQGVEKLESLEELSIDECSFLERLPALSKLKKLRVLSLGGLPPEGLPDLSKFKELRHLSLTGFPREKSLDLHIPDTCLVHFELFLGTYKAWKDACRNGAGDIFNRL
ncbi:hypothetical protein ACJRO7_020801 [Eucalyptus globulus]